MLSQIVHFSLDFKFILQQCILKAILHDFIYSRDSILLQQPLTSNSQKKTHQQPKLYQLSQTASGKTCLIIFQCSNTPLS